MNVYIYMSMQHGCRRSLRRLTCAVAQRQMTERGNITLPLLIVTTRTTRAQSRERERIDRARERERKRERERERNSEGERGDASCL